jgi:acetyl coenzyme A synthetase (ADP forming)-like protein
MPKTRRSYKQLEFFFSPKSVAVIGASNEPNSIGYALLENFLKGGYCKGAGAACPNVFPVNPNHPEVQGKKSFASVKDIPEEIDLAVIAVPARFVPQVAKECCQKKVKAVIVISAGFAEVGEAELTRELQKVIDANPQTRFLGPNCFGVFVAETGMDTTFSARQKMVLPKAGNIAFMSQSGALGITILDWASTQEFGISKFISYGNAMDIDEADLLEYLANDEKTKVIVMYIEGVKEGRKFLRIAKNVHLKKPIVVLKGGVTEEAHKATISHTGSLAGSSEVYKALFKQTGMVQVSDLIEMFNVSKILEGVSVLPKGNRVQIITNGGGYGIITADQAVQKGLGLAQMEEKNREQLKKIFPKTVSLNNPMDLVADADKKRYATAVETALSDKNVDMVLVLILWNTPGIDDGIIDELVKLNKEAKKPMVVVSTGSDYTYQRRKALERGGVVTFSYPSVGATALKALWDYACAKQRLFKEK